MLAKPASATSWLAQEMVQRVIESGILPGGSLSIACGPAASWLDHLQFGDVVCFTGSASTGQWIRRHPVIVERGIRVNIEADSLNAAILGSDAESRQPAFDFFIREVVKEMTVKAGQKCTAIRRILVPSNSCESHDGCPSFATATGCRRRSRQCQRRNGTTCEHDTAIRSTGRKSPN